MDSIENLLRQAVDTFRPAKALRERLKAKIRPAPSTVTVAFISENSRKILDAVFRRNQKLIKKVHKK